MSLSKFAQPEQLPELDSEFRIRDAMARLITGGDVCAALCVYDGRMLASSNTNQNHALVRDYFDFFRTVANSGFTLREIQQDFRHTLRGQMEGLVDQSIQSFLAARAAQSDVRPLQNRIHKIGQILDHHTNPVDRKQLVEEELAVLVELSNNESIRRNPKFMKGIRQKAKQLREAVDVDGNIVNAVTIREYGQGLQDRLNTLLGINEIPELRERLTVDIEKVVGSLAADSRHPLPRDMVDAIRGGVQFIPGRPPGGHAEMNLLDYIIEDRANKGVTSQKDLYIGISKLCCADCEKTIGVLNNNFGEQLGLSVDIRGGHGSQHANRQDPYFVDQIPDFREALDAVNLDPKRRAQEADRSDSDPEIDNLQHRIRPRRRATTIAVHDDTAGLSGSSAHSSDRHLESKDDKDDSPKGRQHRSMSAVSPKLRDSAVAVGSHIPNPLVNREQNDPSSSQVDSQSKPSPSPMHKPPAQNPDQGKPPPF